MLQDNDENNEMELILSGDYSGVEKEQLIKIDDQVAFEEFFGQINKTRKPGIPIPDIDFETKSVLLRLKGTSTNNKSDIALGISSNETLLFNKIKTNSRNETTAVLTPFFIYTIPKTTKSLKIQ
ncbi:hypothetical protein DZC72_14470 [Maribacter algicola]|uniref:Uncharacterized protein n=2 Tax=Maribacter algicola TaxID=2498892 RepID=A0A3R8QZV3_9FLAO|nr:hypothetical protein DZC72_14470 [Maribacter algicola]